MSGRFLRRALILFLALLLVHSAAMAASRYPFFTTTTDSVRLRRGASVRTMALDTLPAGTEIEVQGKSGQFYKVKVDGRTGYILADFVNTSEEAVRTPVPESQDTVEGYPYPSVTKVSVNLRETRSVRGNLVKQIPGGAAIVVREVSGSWAEIEYESLVGYVRTAYIQLKKVVAPKVTRTPAPTPTLSPEEKESGYDILEKGSAGEAVTALQSALIELGFLRGEADGKFGVATENAVLVLQNANGFPTTGIADPNLQAFLYSAKVKNANGQTMKVKTASPALGASLKLGSTGIPVQRLQSILQELGYYAGEATGTYDNATKKAVAAFQKKYGLKEDGVAGADTLSLLYSGQAAGAGETLPPTPTPTPTAIPDFDIPAGKVRLNTEGEDAKRVQARLKDLGYYKGRVDGKFGSASVKALKAFQEANGMEPDGIAGETTYQRMFSWGALAAGQTPTPAPTATLEPTATPAPALPNLTAVPAAYETLKKGMSGQEVVRLQEALIHLHYLAGSSDGQYGESTVEAVRAFQKGNGLTVDGTAGSQTLALLYSTNAKAAPVTPTPAPTKAAAAPTAAPTIAAPTDGPLKKGATGDAVKAIQKRLIELGYLSGTADGDFGLKTQDALMAFQKANGLQADGVAGTKTLAALNRPGAVDAKGKAAATSIPTKIPTVMSATPSASRVLYANWYTTVKDICRKYPYATIYDYRTGISLQIHIFTVGAHADYEPLTAADTAKLERIFGGNTWNPRAVWVVFADGSVYIGSTHSMPHQVQHITDNKFDGHSCLHFPRTQEQVEKIGTYATSHQEIIDRGWEATQAMK